MSALDWIVLFATLTLMVAYGLHKGRNHDSGAQSYLLADKELPWYIVLLGVMATQASAITFLSAPGQAYTDGMRFVQYYFGLPIAMIVICVTFIPIFRRLNIYTAYQYLEERFDRKTRLLTSLLFLLSRGLSTGISIYAPAIILSTMLGWNIYVANIVTGGLLIIYTYTGGAKAVAHTQKLQFLIILASMGIAGYLVVHKLPAGIGLTDALYVAGKAGKLNVITTQFNWKDKYNIWSGIIGGFFLALSYFGTDQSQVGRYITGRDVRQTRLGLLLNGIVKIPMQFAILLIGALVFAFYTFNPSPVYFNSTAYEQYRKHEPIAAAHIDSVYSSLHALYVHDSKQLVHVNATDERFFVNYFEHSGADLQHLRDSIARHISGRYTPDKNDTNYIFLYFVEHELPHGIIGLLFAVIILASWGSISAALNSLTATSLVDVQMMSHKTFTPAEQVRLGRAHTLGWGIFSIGVAMFAARLGSLIEAVNILGSLFYGTILGIFLAAFYVKRAKGSIVFTAAIIAEAAVIVIWVLDIVSFLWLNVIGALLVMVISYLISLRKHSITS